MIKINTLLMLIFALEGLLLAVVGSTAGLIVNLVLCFATIPVAIYAIDAPILILTDEDIEAIQEKAEKENENG